MVEVVARLWHTCAAKSHEIIGMARELTNVEKAGKTSWAWDDCSCVRLARPATAAFVPEGGFICRTISTPQPAATTPG